MMLCPIGKFPSWNYLDSYHEQMEEELKCCVEFFFLFNIKNILFLEKSNSKMTKGSCWSV